ncbi:MAG: hypothetical protein K2J15_06940 [Muribaculaceae bacterium]|nr:hypothetical protein [Muribaculaceae bacterium]
MTTHNRLRPALYSAISLFIIVFIITSCCHTSDAIRGEMDHVAAIIERHPDSALTILESIPVSDIHGRKDRARYSLLHTMALDKNDYELKDFSVLQPALDYYIDHGTPDERMRTRYYEGVIHLQRGDDDNAQRCILDAVADKTKVYKDSLGLALVYIVQSGLYYKQYRVDEFVEFNKKAMKIYESYDPDNHNLIPTYLIIIEGANQLEDYDLADSVFYICAPLIGKDHPKYDNLIGQRLITLISQDSIAALKKYLNNINIDSVKDPVERINVAWALNKIGCSARSLDYINSKENLKTGMATKYLAIKSEILDSLKMYKECKMVFEEYIDSIMDSEHKLRSGGLLFSDKKYEMQIEIATNKLATNRIIIISLVLLILSMLIIFYLYIRKKIEKDRRVNETKERILSQEKEKNLRLEYEKETLESENLRLQYNSLLEEKNELEQNLNSSTFFSEEIKEIIKKRLDILNVVITEEIRSEKSEKKSWDKLREFIHKDKKEFMKSTRKALSLSNPKLINKFKEIGLSDLETDLACLYALGLRGSEAGAFLELKDHYHISSAMRKKFGLSDRDTNLNIYIQRLFKEL